MRGRKSNRAGADNCNSKIEPGLGAAGIDIDGMFRFWTVPFGEKSLESTDRNGFVDLAASARGLARMSADASADAGHRIGLAGGAIGFFEVAFGNLRNVATRIGGAGQAIMQGKLVFNQSLSTFLSMKRCCTRALPFCVRRRG